MENPARKGRVNTVIRWLWLLRPDVSLSDWRKNTAFGKGLELGRVVKRSDLPDALRRDLKAWVTRYQAAVTELRKVVAHGHAFTESIGPDGWKAGLAYTWAKGHAAVARASPAADRDAA